MSGPDMILGFIISYADGKLQEYMNPNLESLLEKCYDRALKKWSKNEGIRRHMELGYHRHVQQLTETILQQLFLHKKILPLQTVQSCYRKLCIVVTEIGALLLPKSEHSRLPKSVHLSLPFTQYFTKFVFWTILLIE